MRRPRRSGKLAGTRGNARALGIRAGQGDRCRPGVYQEMHSCSANLGVGVKMPVFRPRYDHLGDAVADLPGLLRSEEHASELQSLMRISYAVFCLKKKNITHKTLHK